MGTVNKPFVLKPYTKKDLRILMGVPITTFSRWLATIPDTEHSKRCHWLSTTFVRAFVEKYGSSKMIKEMNESHSD
jgi:hypothetical protein